MKRIRLRFILISAIVLFIVLFSIIFGLNIANSANMHNQNSETIQFIHNMINSKDMPFPDIPKNDDPEEKFRNRFFVANFSNGKLVNVDITNVARINEAEASSIANKVYSKGSLEGNIDVYQYSAVSDEGLTKYVFLDVQKQSEQVKQVILVSSLIALGGYIIVLLLIFFFSGLVIKPIELADAKQKRFITDASHELKTPLTVINSNLEIIEMENGENEWTSSSKKQIENLTSMTNQLVLLSRLNEYDVKTNITEFEIKPIIENASMAYISLLKKKDIDLSITCEESLKIRTDATILGQICNILLDNMLKYAFKGEASIVVERNKNNVIVTFSNRLNPDSQLDINSLFDRFYRGDSSRNASTKGFGIGLSLAKSLADIIKAKMNVSINDGRISFKLIF